ncbi:hypothetical protein RSOLAG22IIIB_06908 [Rhizoctonia solani]|uniref:Uncharacterized protein n=1 Tax=Rhizoctonia solani TaxID=456999 RepID=A0A0K6GHL4_9AGAM|nr:hypothetical protein RSOLAG22IIIB_06908 [Rhizoctonia solani]
MACASHPHWGSLVGVCTSSSDVERLSLHTSSEADGIQALRKISRLSSESYDRVQTELGRQIDMPTLQAALLLARDPKTVSHLADPPVLKACVRLMKSVEESNPTEITPFSHEYGFLCFRLFVAVFNVCFLKRWDKLEEALPLCDRDPELAAHTFTSWSAPANLLQPALLPLSDVSILFDLIWNDRKQFLLSHIPFTPESTGLSGLIFLFSRYVANERTNKKQLQHKLYEIALRYVLIADPGQRRATIDVIDANKCADDWFVTPKHIDADDSRFILCAYLRTMTLYKDIYTTLHPPVMLRLVALSVDDSSQDMLPEVVRWTIEYGWRRFLSLDDEEDNFEMFIHLFVSSLSFLLLPPLDNEVRLVPSTQSKIIDTMHKGGLLDWVARALIRLRPPSSLAESEENGDNDVSANTCPSGGKSTDYSPRCRLAYLRFIESITSIVHMPGSGWLRTWGSNPRLTSTRAHTVTTGKLSVVRGLGLAVAGVFTLGIAMTVASEWTGNSSIPIHITDTCTTPA